MARCATCGNMIVFGGVSWDDQRFCKDECMQTAVTASYAEDIPEDIVQQHAMTLRNDPCPVCGGDGPNDFHSSWSVVSLFVFTLHNKKQIFGCNWCGSKHKVKYFIVTGVCGWWGFPWGFLITPLLEVANVLGFFYGVPVEPSEELKQLALTQITEELRRRVEEDDGERDGDWPDD